jgi:hypothetical protein
MFASPKQTLLTTNTVNTGIQLSACLNSCLAFQANTINSNSQITVSFVMLYRVLIDHSLSSFSTVSAMNYSQAFQFPLLDLQSNLC